MTWLRGADGRSGCCARCCPTGEPTLPAARFDLLIVDEAHHVRPGRRRGSGTPSTRSGRRLIRGLAPHFEHRLFLSATPHNGYPETFTALLETARRPAVRPRRRARPASSVEAVMVRRLKARDAAEAGRVRRGSPSGCRSAIEVAYTGRRARRPRRCSREYAELRPQAHDRRRGRASADLVDAAAEEAAVLLARARSRHTSASTGRPLASARRPRHGRTERRASPSGWTTSSTTSTTYDDEELRRGRGRRDAAGRPIRPSCDASGRGDGAARADGAVGRAARRPARRQGQGADRPS